MQVLDNRVHSCLLGLYADTDRTHILEATSSYQEHELNHLSVLEVEYLEALNGENQLVVD